MIVPKTKRITDERGQINTTQLRSAVESNARIRNILVAGTGTGYLSNHRPGGGKPADFERKERGNSFDHTSFILSDADEKLQVFKQLEVVRKGIQLTQLLYEAFFAASLDRDRDVTLN